MLKACWLPGLTATAKEGWRHLLGNLGTSSWRVSRQTVAEASRLALPSSGRDARTTDWSETLQPQTIETPEKKDCGA